jgi:hypothetical protein
VSFLEGMLLWLVSFFPPESTDEERKIQREFTQHCWEEVAKDQLPPPSVTLTFDSVPPESLKPPHK